MPSSPVLQGPREACGVLGMVAPGTDAARTAYFGLHALQHRGQESAGIAASDTRDVRIHRAMGLVMQVFDEQSLAPLVGPLCIGHTRYSTAGASELRNAQPCMVDTIHGPLAVAHNGHLIEAERLRRNLLERGVGLVTSTDSEVITQMLAMPLGQGEAQGPDWVGRLAAFMAAAEGAFSLVVLTRDAVFGARDRFGFRPLCIGELRNGGEGGWVVASESCALATVGARYLREVAPGEIVRLGPEGLHAFRGRDAAPSAALCIFEYVYFARPDSMLDGQSVHDVRHRLGELLWQQAPADADIVVAVPDSARSAAIGYATASGIPYSEGLIKNRYIGRTFIQPDERLRRTGVRLKYNPLAATLEGKRIVLVDDSIVRGTTAGPIVQLLRETGARAVHLRVAAPPVRYPCFMGLDVASFDELLASRMSVEQIRDHVGADSLGYLTTEGLRQAVGARARSGHCTACFTGRYPVRLAESGAEPACGPRARSPLEQGARDGP